MEVYIRLNLLICYDFNKLTIIDNHDITPAGEINKVLTCMFFKAFSLLFTALGKLKMKKQIRAITTVNTRK